MYLEPQQVDALRLLIFGLILLGILPHLRKSDD